ncbi:lasso peptide biosynthesis PqqD family chaperone [Bacillus sp. FJAT-50079]|uniref:lasso peptide biosynthesis PqqD family chaperone n=1 Tax=Bacillus sp. FJAT-50079 TaxID=2833577 RepID=UPI001BCA283E|nr:lasso peptide biosynthesis PqqD family chaperone [Bacillus sp. FJAT-50079]MBS4209173.1 lasso peptide biosynthesis PqqD family chaperone [Bacillus sp. FJAT-50079]
MITNQSILLNDIVSQREGHIVSDMGGEKVMLSIDNGKYYNLGETGGVIWDVIKEPVSVNKIITTLLSNYQIDQEECEEQVITFLLHLFEEGLIEITNKGR